MPDTTKTYTANVEMETKDAEKNVELLKKTVTTSLGEFNSLTQAISKTQDTLGKLDPKSEKFKELSKELEGLKDTLQDVEIQSSSFTDALAAQPGAIGFVGQSMKGLDGTFKVFMANPIIAVVAGISAIFLALRESLQRTEEGTAKLNKITDGLTKIMNGLFAVIEPIAMELADLIIGILESEAVMNTLSKTIGVLSGVFTGLFGTVKEIGSFIINVLVTNFKTLVAVAKGAGDVIAGVFTFDWKRVREGANATFKAVSDGVKNQVDNVKTLASGVIDSVVDGFNAGADGFKNGFERLLETEKEERKKLEEERKKLEAEEEARREKARKEAQAKREKEEEEQRKRQEVAEKILLEAQLSLLSERDRAIEEREMRFQKELAALKAAGIEDLTAFEEEYRLDALAINEKFDEEELRRTEEQNKKLQAERDKAAEIERQQKEEYDNFIIDSEQFKADAIAVIQDQQVSNIRAVGGVLGTIAGSNKRLAIAGLVIEQSANIAKVVIDTARSITAATAAAAPFIANPITAIPASANLARVIAQSKLGAGVSIAGIIAGAAKGISQINSVAIPGGGGSGGAGGGGVRGVAGGGVSFFTPQVPTTGIPQIETGTDNDPTSQIRDAITQSSRRPIKAFVVSQDISTTQALDRRTNRAATFG